MCTPYLLAHPRWSGFLADIQETEMYHLKLTLSQLQPILNHSKCYCKNGDPETNSGFTVILKFSFPMPSGIKQSSHCTKYLVITW